MDSSNADAATSSLVCPKYLARALFHHNQYRRQFLDRLFFNKLSFIVIPVFDLPTSVVGLRETFESKLRLSFSFLGWRRGSVLERRSLAGRSFPDLRLIYG